VITRVLLDLDALFLEHRLCGDLNNGTDDEREWLACGACGTRIGSCPEKHRSSPKVARSSRRVS
jgi:hypothetical protein